MVQGLPEESDLPPLPLSRRNRWLRGIAWVGGGLTLGSLGLGWWGYSLARRELPQFLQRNLSTALGRPLKVGEFERFSPTGVRLGPSIVPPTEADFSWVKARALEVNFNPLELLLTRTLRPSLVFVEPQVSLKQGFDGEWRVQPPQSVGEDRFLRTELRSLQIRNADLAIGPISRSSIVELPEGVTSATLVLLENVNLRVRFSGPDNQTASVVVGGRLNNGAFQLRGQGQLDSREFNLAVQAQQLPIEAVNPLFGGSFFVRNGLLSSNLDLRFRPQADTPLTVKGTARLRNGDVVLADLPSPLQAINGTLALDGVGGTLENSSLYFGPILVKAEGRIDADQGHDLAIALLEVSLAQVTSALGQALPVEAEGRFQVQAQVTGPLRQPQVAGTLANLGLVQVDRLGLESVAAQFGANLDGATLHQATLRPVTGGTVTAQGQASLALGQRSPTLALTAQTDLPLDGMAKLYGLALPAAWQLGPLRAEAEIAGSLDDLRGQAIWQLPQATFPGQGQVSYTEGQVQATDTEFQVGDGTLRAGATADLGSRVWRATASGLGLSLRQVAPQLRGTLDTDLQVSGSLTAFNPGAIRAQGQARFSDAVPFNLEALEGLNLAQIDRVNWAGLDSLLPGPLSTRFAWTGRRLAIEEAIAPGLSAQGEVDVDFSASGLPQVGSFDLTARLQALELAIAYGLINGPPRLRPQGTLAFDGSLRGTLSNPTLAGTVGLRQVRVNDVALVKEVVGPVRISRADGAAIALEGEGEAIAASLAPDLRPNAFQLVSGDTAITGRRQGNILDTQVRNLDLGLLALRPLAQPDLGLLGGMLNATAAFDLGDLANLAVSAEFTLDQLALGAIGGDRLSGQVQYRDGVARLTGGALQLTPTTQFQITGSGRLFPQWQGQAELTTAGADFQDLLGVLRLYSYADFGRLLDPPSHGSAADLAVTSVGVPQASLDDQAALAHALRDALATSDRRRARALLPALDQLEGQVSGGLGVRASAAEGLAGSFEFRGQNWAWGRYDFDNEFLARGRLVDQVISLEPVEFRAGAARLSLVGDLSAQSSNLAIAATALPLAAASTLLESPIEVTGLLNLGAQLTGPYTNPNLVGQLAIDEARVNQQPLTAIDSQFQYQNAVFKVAGQVVGPEPEPLRFAGTIPYALPFMTVLAPSDQMALKATLHDDALALVNLFTPALAWGGGRATVALSLGGTPYRPLLSGLIAFDDASFVSPWLGASLDNLTGAIQLQGTQISVDSLTGTLLDGQFRLAGQLPLTQQDIAPDDVGLHLALTAIDFNYANEVRTQVNGEIALTQALLAPTIGGQVDLHNTQLAVGQNLMQLANRLRSQFDFEALRNTLAQTNPLLPVQLDDLRISLAPARVKALPLASLDLEGAIALNGSLPGVTADGALMFTNGWVNTVTTEFFLESGRDNRVIFAPENGLIPYLDLAFSATVPLQRQYNLFTQTTLNSTTGAAEIPSLNPLASTTVLDELAIEARLSGQASRLLDTLSLTSTPPYSQDQLLGMVTGGYLTGVGGTEPGLALGSNLVGAFFADSQDAVAQSLGLRRLRLVGSTVLPSATKDTIGLSIGASVGITENLSANLVQVLNQNQPLALSARYRIDSNWSIGGSTDAGSNGRAFVHYRLNFP